MGLGVRRRDECRQNVAEPTTATAGLGHVVRSSAEVVTHQVCAQGRGRDVSARGRATAGVGSETAGGGLANATARPPRCSAASIALTWQHRTPSYPAGAGGAAMSPQKSKWGATPYAAVAGPPAAAAVTQSALPRNCFASGGRRRTWAACGSQFGLSREAKILRWLNTGLGSSGWPGRAPEAVSDLRPPPGLPGRRLDRVHRCGSRGFSTPVPWCLEDVSRRLARPVRYVRRT